MYMRNPQAKDFRIPQNYGGTAFDSYPSLSAENTEAQESESIDESNMDKKENEEAPLRENMDFLVIFLILLLSKETEAEDDVIPLLLLLLLR